MNLTWLVHKHKNEKSPKKEWEEAALFHHGLDR